jgi:hypothetical protein
MTVLFDQMGQTPWYAGRDMSFVDSLGLIDRPVGFYKLGQRAAQNPALAVYQRVSEAVAARLWPQQKRTWDRQEMLDYLFGRKPDIIMIHQALLERKRETIPEAILLDPRLESLYQPVFLINGSIRVYERQGLKLRQGPPLVPPHTRVEELDIKNGQLM